MACADRFRGTGRTSRMLIQALGIAADSKTVLVIVANTREIGAMMALITTLPEFKAIPYAKLAMPSNEVTLWPQGAIRFVSAEDPQWSWSLHEMRGYPRGMPILIDHHAEEVYEDSLEIKAKK